MPNSLSLCLPGLLYRVGYHRPLLPMATMRLDFLFWLFWSLWPFCWLSISLPMPQPLLSLMVLFHYCLCLSLSLLTPVSNSLASPRPFAPILTLSTPSLEQTVVADDHNPSSHHSPKAPESFLQLQMSILKGACHPVFQTQHAPMVPWSPLVSQASNLESSWSLPPSFPTSSHHPIFQVLSPKYLKNASLPFHTDFQALVQDFIVSRRTIAKSPNGASCF